MSASPLPLAFKLPPFGILVAISGQNFTSPAMTAATRAKYSTYMYHGVPTPTMAALSGPE